MASEPAANSAPKQNPCTRTLEDEVAANKALQPFLDNSITLDRPTTKRLKAIRKGIGAALGTGPVTASEAVSYLIRHWVGGSPDSIRKTYKRAPTDE